jgi:hypothetical protein
MTNTPTWRDDLNAIDELRRQLEKPLPTENWQRGTGEVFDPWAAFPCLYGSYSSDFDDMAILVLDNLLNKRWGPDHGEGLAHQMFREMLCTAGLCDYGTSPRGCFPDHSTVFPEMLPLLLEKWRSYRSIQWEL